MLDPQRQPARGRRELHHALDGARPAMTVEITPLTHSLIRKTKLIS
jgi:hypothetical protein